MTPTRTALSILISAENSGKIQIILDAVQGRAYANILCSNAILSFATQAEQLLAKIPIAASYRAGSQFTSSPAGPEWRSYSYKRLGTVVHIERRKKGWYLTCIERMSTWPKQAGKETLALTKNQKFMAFYATLRQFDICQEDAYTALSRFSKKPLGGAAQ